MFAPAETISEGFAFIDDICENGPQRRDRGRPDRDRGSRAKGTIGAFVQQRRFAQNRVMITAHPPLVKSLRIKRPPRWISLRGREMRILR